MSLNLRALVAEQVVHIALRDAGGAAIASVEATGDWTIGVQDAIYARPIELPGPFDTAGLLVTITAEFYGLSLASAALDPAVAIGPSMPGFIPPGILRIVF